MVKKTLAAIFVFSLLAVGFLYNEWKGLSKDPEFTIVNSSGSLVSVKASWRGSEANIVNLRDGGRFTFFVRDEASMNLQILRPESEVEKN